MIAVVGMDIGEQRPEGRMVGINSGLDLGQEPGREGRSVEQSKDGKNIAQR